MRQFIKTHPGKYCYDVIIGNNYAELFWNHIFTDIGAVYYPLQEIRDPKKSDILHLYGWETA